MTPPPTKALIIRFSSVGDIILSSLLIRVFRRTFPDCRLDFAVKTTYADLVRHNPYISNVIAFPEKGSFAELARMRTMIRETGYDLIMDIHDSIRSRVITFGHPRTVRINKRKLARFLLVKTGLNMYARLGGSPGVAERYLEPVRSLGVVDDGNGPEVFFPAGTELMADSLLGGREGQFVGVAPGSIHWNKMWPPDRFARVALTIALEKRAGVILFGSAREKDRCDEIENILRTEQPDLAVVNTAAKTSLLEVAALMDRCLVVLTNDSGLLHLAAARKRPVVAVFGPTVKEFGFFPTGTRSRVVENPTLNCRPCTHIGLNECPKGHFRCMTEIEADVVLTAAREMLDA